MQNDLVEIVARATCQWDGTDPEEIMPDGKPRWCDRIDSVTFLLGHALQSAGYAVVPVEPTEAMIEATRNMTMPCSKQREGVRRVLPPHRRSCMGGLLRRVAEWLKAPVHRNARKGIVGSKPTAS